MIGGKWLWTLAVVMLAAGLASSTSAQQGAMKLLNPKGQEPSDLVRQVMKKYGIEQGRLEFLKSGRWIYASEISAVVAVETGLRAKTTLEYGETVQYGAKVDGEGQHYIHVFHLKDLKPETTYHVRVSAVERNGGKADTGDFTVATRTMKDVVRIPDDLDGPPYELNKPETTYLVTKDITAPRTAFNVSAADVTLDLGGHTVVYNEEHMGLPTDSFNNMVKQSAFGVRVGGRGVERVRILNGTLRQGKGNDEASYTTIGFNPIYLSGAAGSEIAGVSCTYSGTQLSGIYTHWPGANITIHHNVVEDKGRLIANRHRQCKAIALGSTGGKAWNNLVKRTRQVGIGGGAKNAELFNNEVHVDSHSINGGGVGAKAGSVIHHNRIFGCGDNVVGVATTGGKSSANVKVHHNYIWLHAHDIAEYKKYLSKKAMESSAYSIMSGARITWGCDNPEYHDNVFLMTARDGGKIRGTFFYADAKSKGAVFRDNLVIAICENEKSDNWGAIGGVGSYRSNAIPIVFQNNTIVSNFVNFNMMDSYGCSKNYRFVGNKFVRAGNNPKYLTIHGWGRAGGSIGHVFIDSEFEGGAGYDKVRTPGSFTVKWTLTLLAPAGAQVVIRDKDGTEAFKGNVGADGKLDVPLTQYRFEKAKQVPATPHTVTVTKNGKSAEKSVTMDAKKAVEIKP